MTHAFARKILPALALGTALSGCAYLFDGAMEVDGVALSDLDTSGSAPSDIGVYGPDNVIITQGDAWAITLEGDEAAGKALRFDLDGDRLKIARDTSVFDGRGTATVRITMPAPSELSTAGSGSITADTLAGDAVIDVKGSGSISVASVDSDDLEIDIKGSGNVEAAGTAKRLEIDIKGKGAVMLAKLTADDVTIDIKGSGDITLASNGKVHADIKGSGDILVTGSASCTKDVKGSGTLRCEPAKRAVAKPEGSAEAE